MAIIFENGMNSIPIEANRINSRSVSELANEAALQSILGLEGDESFEILETDDFYGDEDTYEPIEGSYVPQDGDTIRFVRSSGDKG